MDNEADIVENGLVLRTTTSKVGYAIKKRSAELHKPHLLKRCKAMMKEAVRDDEGELSPLPSKEGQVGHAGPNSRSDLNLSASCMWRETDVLLSMHTGLAHRTMCINRWYAAPRLAAFIGACSSPICLKLFEGQTLRNCA